MFISEGSEVSWAAVTDGSQCAGRVSELWIDDGVPYCNPSPDGAFDSRSVREANRVGPLLVVDKMLPIYHVAVLDACYDSTLLHARGVLGWLRSSVNSPAEWKRRIPTVCHRIHDPENSEDLLPKAKEKQRCSGQSSWASRSKRFPDMQASCRYAAAEELAHRHSDEHSGLGDRQPKDWSVPTEQSRCVGCGMARAWIHNRGVAPIYHKLPGSTSIRVLTTSTVLGRHVVAFPAKQVLELIRKQDENVGRVMYIARTARSRAKQRWDRCAEEIVDVSLAPARLWIWSHMPLTESRADDCQEPVTSLTGRPTRDVAQTVLRRALLPVQRAMTAVQPEWTTASEAKSHKPFASMEM
nr:hypothetical protein CFP56_52303 [Quercus suber]